MNSVTLCHTADMEHLYENLFNRLAEKQKPLENEIHAAQTDETNWVTMAFSFLPPSIHPHDEPSRSKRAIGLIAAAAEAARLSLSDPVKEAPRSALSVFNLCTDTTDLENDIDGTLATQNMFQVVLQRVQTRNDENFFLLGIEIKDLQDSVLKITKLVGTKLKALETKLLQIKGVIARLLVCNRQLIHSMPSCQQFRDYIDHLGTLYTHVISYKAAFYAYQIKLYSTISSLAATYVSLQFLFPSQLATIVNKLAHHEILRVTKLSAAIHVGQEAIYYEIQMVLENYPLQM